MTVTIKDFLICLDQEALTRLIKLRELKTSRTLDGKRKTLAYSYKGDLKTLINEHLRKSDLINIINKLGIVINGAEYSVPNLEMMKIDNIRHLAVNAFCHQMITKEMLVGGTDAAIRLYSNKYSNDNVDLLNIEVLRKALKGMEEVCIASAFYDIKFFKQLFKPPIKNFRKIQIVLNGLFGQRLDRQKDELNNLYKTIQKNCKKTKIEIRLLMQNGIFHPKVYLFKGKLTKTAFIGSMNTTNAGLEINEEILLNITGNTMPFEIYFETIWGKAKKFNVVKTPKARNLIGFFRTGILYFKPEYQFQLTYNPFSDLLRIIPDQEKEKLVERIPYSEAETGIGAFSIPVCLAMNSDSFQMKSRSSIKPYSIETNLGYWVPSPYEEKIKSVFINQQKKEYYFILSQKINGKDDEYFMEQYHSYRDASKKRLYDAIGKKRIDEYLKDINQKKTRMKYAPFNDEEGFKNFFKRLKDKINDEKYIEKLCQRFIPGPLPEIWDDHAAYIDFKTSFFEYLDFIDTQNISRIVPKTILSKINNIKQLPNNEKKLKYYLENNGWSLQKDWPQV